MNVTRKHYIKRMYNIFHDIVKAGATQQEAFDELTEGQTRSVKNQLRAYVRECGYQDVS